MSLRCASIGECMVELRPRPDGAYARGFAGDAYNTAVYLRRQLGPDDEVAFVTATGDDALSDHMRLAWGAEGIDDRLAARAPGGTPGLYMIELDEAGDRDFLYWRSASAARDWMRELAAAGGADALAGLDLVYLSGISLAILGDDDRASALRLLADLRGRVGRLAFDPNVRPRLWSDPGVARATVEAAAALCDIVLPSTQDGEFLWAGERDPGAQLARWRALGDPEVALTLAAEGVVVASTDGEHRLPGHPAPRVVDTSGAGDSFNGAYLAARLCGAAPVAAAERALRLAAEVVGAPGAILPRPRGGGGRALQNRDLRDRI